MLKEGQKVRFNYSNVRGSYYGIGTIKRAYNGNYDIILADNTVVIVGEKHLTAI